MPVPTTVIGLTMPMPTVVIGLTMPMPTVVIGLTMPMPEAHALDRHAQVVGRVLAQLADWRVARHLWCHTRLG